MQPWSPRGKYPADESDSYVQGYTELTIVPTEGDLRTVWLHARSLAVLGCSLRLPTIVPLAYSHLPPAVPALTQPENIHTYPEMKRQIWRADHEGDEGELGIAIPQGCIVRTDKGRTPAASATTSTSKADAKAAAAAAEQGPKLDEYEPFTIAVEYEVTKPGLGLVVVGPDDANPSVSPVMPLLSCTCCGRCVKGGVCSKPKEKGSGNGKADERNS